MKIFALLFLISQDRPIIRLEESLIEGNVRKPALIELKSNQKKLDQAVEDAALRNLIDLEKKLLKRRPL